MNNVFSSKRFGKYFSYDLKHATDNFGLSLLILGCLPVIMFAFVEVICHLATDCWEMDNTPNRIIAFMIAICVTTFMFPAKAYGDITDRRAGSTFLMVPASTFEKWLSCTLITVVLLPLALGILLLGTDMCMGLIFPNLYGEPVVFQDWFRFAYTIPVGSEQFTELGGMNVHVWLLIWASWITSIMTFMMGAIYFKKSKVAKTFLTMIILSMFISLVATPFAVGLDNPEHWMNLSDEIDAWRAATWVINGLEIAAFLGVLYARFRTIKH